MNNKKETLSDRYKDDPDMNGTCWVCGEKLISYNQFNFCPTLNCPAHEGQDPEYYILLKRFWRENIQEKYEEVLIDWKQFSQEAEEQFKTALKNLGIRMIDDPEYEGSDMYGYILIKEKGD